jgi:hypothetical protein
MEGFLIMFKLLIQIKIKTMKKINLLVTMIIGIVIFSSCQKEEVQAPVIDAKKPQNMSELLAIPSFKWKTTKNYQITLTGNYNDVVTVKSKSGVVFHKSFMKAAAAYKINLTLPASEKTVQLIYHGQDVECTLTQTTINYSFN